MEGPGSGTEKHMAWLQFKNLLDFSLVGNGRINGKGNRWWSQVCRPTMKVRYHEIIQSSELMLAGRSCSENFYGVQ